MDYEARANAIVDTYLAGHYKVPHDLRNVISSYGRSIEKEVWEAAAKRLDEFNDDPGRYSEHLQAIVTWMREQATQARQGG